MALLSAEGSGARRGAIEDSYRNWRQFLKDFDIVSFHTCD
jgi:hypothetical protein